jgi:arylsulfatase A-like enzyme
MEDLFGSRQPTAIAELMDIFPTVCDFCGVDVPESVEGKSLRPVCLGEADSVRDYLHGEHFFGPDSNHWILQGSFKYVWFSQSGVELLFDIREDPKELHNLAPSMPDKLGSLRQILVRELTDAPEGFVRDGELIHGRPQAARLDQIPATPKERLSEIKG